jgi:glyoxylase-like metal-dependent hydrolase (beta-lactamase superfamily II)
MTLKTGKPFLVTFIYCALAATTVHAQELSPANSMAEFCARLPRPAYAELERVPYASDWFELYRVAPGITAIYEPFQWQEVISYLIEGTDSALLFDTGNGIADIAAVARELTSKPIAVLNSHTHYDHVGGNYAFDSIYGMNTAFTRERQLGHPNKDIAIEASPAALCRDLPQGVSMTNHVGRPFAITQFVEDGHTIDLGGRKLEVLHMPGHTPDSIALLDAENGLMWTGDTFYEGPIWLYAPETDFEAYAESLAKLVQYVPQLTALLPAHNTPWVRPEVLLEAQAGFKAMLAGKAEIVDQGDGMFEYRLPGITAFSFLLSSDTRP